MATVKLIALIFALNYISVSTLKLYSKRINREEQEIWCPAECIQTDIDPCEPNPCLYGGECVVTTTQNDYRCVDCPYPTGGKNCTDLTCGSDCFRVGNRVYFIYPNNDRDFSSSKSKCQAEGMRMAVFKDAIVHDPVRRYLEAREVNRLDDNSYCYWIGLSRASDSAPWKWADGTEMDAYQPWFVPPYSGDNCANICDGKWAYKFSSDRCFGNDKWIYFTLCEHSLPVSPN